LSGGRSKVGLESTVLDVTRKPFRILRPGAVTLEELRQVVPGIAAFSGSAPRGAAASPGLKHRHYQPSCRVVLVEPGQWGKTLRRWSQKNHRLGTLAFGGALPRRAPVVFSRGFGRDARRFARELYASFFDAEQARVQTLLVESVSKKGVGAAVMDRLSRAAAR
jgi:L-threonylcarbamoyladenylate synthase